MRDARRFQPLPRVGQGFDGFFDVVDESIHPRGIDRDEQFFFGAKVVVNRSMQDAKCGRYIAHGCIGIAPLTKQMCCFLDQLGPSVAHGPFRRVFGLCAGDADTWRGLFGFGAGFGCGLHLDGRKFCQDVKR